MTDSSGTGVEHNAAGTPSHVVLRVYNYYRIFLSFCLLYLYFNMPEQTVVGQQYPALFQQLVFYYFPANVFIALATLLLPEHYLVRRAPLLAIFCADIAFVGLLMFASGGVNSMLGNILMIPVAFAGAIAFGRMSLAVAAAAVLACLYQEFYLHVSLDRSGTDQLVKAGTLGITFFVVNVVFQFLYRQMRHKDKRIVMLQQVRELEQVAATTRQELEQSTRRMEALLQSAGDGVLGLEEDGNISFANPRAHDLLESPDGSLVGRSIVDFLLPVSGDSAVYQFNADRNEQRQDLLSFLPRAPAGEFDSECWQSSRGRKFHVDYSCNAITGGEADGVVVVFQDATKRRDQDAKLQRLANFDTLTGLANRAHFQHFLERALAQSERSGLRMAVLFIDLDNFKYVNDSFGHEAGDEMLRTVAERISGRVRAGDIVARLGGDEFAVALQDIKREGDAASVAEGILDAVSQPMELAGAPFNGSISIGIAVYGPGGRAKGSSEILRCADAAMYSSKAKGGGCFHFFEPDMQEEIRTKRRIQKQLENAIQNEELSLLYQPIIKLSDRSVRGSEALLRWTNAEGEAISPEKFIPVAESSGQIIELGHWVVCQVCRELKQWYARYDTYHKVAINISTQQLRTGEFRKAFQQAMETFSIPAHCLELELTETGVIDDPRFVMSELNLIHDMGINISIDDFGTGYSSLDYLRRLPLDYLKIDRSFTADINKSAAAEELIRVMVAIAHTLGLQVIAEGVENTEQLAFLEDLGCDHAQGYLFGRPGQLAEAITTFVDTPLRSVGAGSKLSVL
jgi:diguanylate cyclase (GGDEF)-like protein